MANKDDGAPFIVLQKDAETFKNSFQHDIDDCICTLNSKITSLICEPESLSNPFGEHRHRQDSSARTEFAKAKYDVFMTVKTLFNNMEDKWRENISNIKETFLESVELFLAGTKLEVKFPSSTELAFLSNKLSPLSKEKKSPNSIYPSLHHLVEESFVSTKRDSLRRKTFCGLNDLSSSPALNLSPLKQNLCDIEEEEINDDNENIVEFLPDEDMCSPERFVRTNSRRKTIHDKHVDNNITDNQSQYVSPRTTSRKRSINSKPVVPETDLSDGEFSFPEETVKTNTRRKTFHSRFVDNDLPESDFVPEKITRTKSKRKTICPSLLEDKEEPCVASPKRLKRSGSLKTSRSSITGANTTAKSFSLMDCDETASDKSFADSSVDYSNWISIQSVNDSVPSCPGVYELKVWRAKKSAYIGSSENLLHQLSLHKKMQNSGRKHLDKFLERNVSDVQVRYKVWSSITEAKLDEKNKLKEFADKYKTTPAYN